MYLDYRNVKIELFFIFWLSSEKPKKMAIWSSLSRSMGSVAQMASFLKTPAAAKIAQNGKQ